MVGNGFKMHLENTQYCINIDICSVDGVSESFDFTFYPNGIGPSDLVQLMSIEVSCMGKGSDFRIALIGQYYSDDEHCAILESSILTVLLNDRVVQIDLASRALIRNVQIDSLGRNFGIYRINNRFIIHGEIDITCLDSDCNTVWSFAGRDIFASGTDKKCFEISDEIIKLYDFYDYYYEIDLNGVLKRNSGKQ